MLFISKSNEEHNHTHTDNLLELVSKLRAFVMNDNDSLPYFICI